MTRTSRTSSLVSPSPRIRGPEKPSTEANRERIVSDSDSDQPPCTRTSSNESSCSDDMEDALEDCDTEERHGVRQIRDQASVPVRSHPKDSSNPPRTSADSSLGLGEDVQKQVPQSRNIDPDREVNSADSCKEIGYSFEKLIDRLLAQPSSKSDIKFETIFLCMYRKFASPYALIEAITRRFEDIEKNDLTDSSRSVLQLRYLTIVKDWVSDYPGDFAHPLSRRLLNGFLQNLAASHKYPIVCREIGSHLEVVCEDDDTEWACSDKLRSRANTMESFLTMSSAQSALSVHNIDSPTLTANSSTEDVTDTVSPEKLITTKGNRSSATPSSTSSISRSDSQSAHSFQTLLNTLENTQRQAQLLTPVPRNILTKVHWHQLMQIPDASISRELTRIDWIMFSAIRPRDLIRHVLLQPDQKEKCTSLEHVNRMIYQFNHVAFWVTNMILLRDKPKHRAKALEKFMGIAWKLRHLNNYNSLGAVIAGINGTAVHRLAQTRELVSPEAQKQFMRLEILMGTQKSHFAYRLAFGNTTSSRIPFLPLHRRDLVLAEQGNNTYVNGSEPERINWKKFEVMGEVILTIRNSQQIGYPTIIRNEEVQRLVLEGRFCKDDDVSLPTPILSITWNHWHLPITRQRMLKVPLTTAF